MKKALAILLVMFLALGLVACGGEEELPESPPGQGEEYQAMIDADYDQLVTLMELVAPHSEFQVQLLDLEQQVRDGTAGEKELLDFYKKMSEDSQAMLDVVKNAKWKTDTFERHIALLVQAYEALAKSERLLYEAGLENDRDKLSRVPEAFEQYEAKMDELLTLMGV